LPIRSFDTGCRKLNNALRTHDITKPQGGLNTCGTAVLVNIINEAGGLPTCNFREGCADAVERGGPHDGQALLVFVKGFSCCLGSAL